VHVPHPLVFAHRGGRKHAPENTVLAFRRAVARGATGIETDAYLTRDGVVVLTHDPAVRIAAGRSRLISELDRAQLPPHVPTLEDLLDVVEDDHDLFIDVKDLAALPGIAEAVSRRRPAGEPRLWLAHAGFRESDWRVVAGWTAAVPGVQLVDSTSLTRMGGDPAGHLARLSRTSISWLNLPIREWTPELVTLTRSSGLRPMAFRVHRAGQARRALRLGLDAVHGDDVDALLAVVSPDPAESGVRDLQRWRERLRRPPWSTAA
jgi:glycerophosphoryl diester phosphodiesterase